MVQDARAIDEQATQRRSQILGLTYIDTSKLTNKILYQNRAS